MLTICTCSIIVSSDVQNIDKFVQKEIKVARIPFELNDEIKDAFVDRIMLYGENSIIASRPSMSQVLRSVVSLVVTMDDSVLSDFLELAGKSESILSEYLELFKEYSKKGLIPKGFTVINPEFEKTFELLRNVKLGKISEDEFKEKIGMMEITLLSYRRLQKDTSETMNRYANKGIFQSHDSITQQIEKSSIAKTVVDGAIRKNLGE